MTITLRIKIDAIEGSMTRLRIGFKGKNQLPWIMIFREYWKIDIDDAKVVWEIRE